MSELFVDIVRRQKEWSARTFGPGSRTAGVLAHIRLELVEVEADPDNLSEWMDIVILAIDGAWRAGHSPEAIAAALSDKQSVNERREWPDWVTADPNGPIEHKRATENDGAV